MLDSLHVLFIMDGSGPYVWLCFFVLMFVISVNIILPIMRMKKIYKEGRLED